MLYNIYFKIKIICQTIKIIFNNKEINNYDLIFSIIKFDRKSLFKQLFVCFNIYFGRVIVSSHSKYILFNDDNDVKLNLGSYDYL